MMLTMHPMSNMNSKRMSHCAAIWMVAKEIGIRLEIKILM